MASTKRLLDALTDNLAESMGQRNEPAAVRIAPAANAADVGRRPAPQFGQIEVNRILPDPDQPRVRFDNQAIERLATSLQNAGQLAPIRVRWSGRHRRWLIVAGERRWRAARHAGLETIECYFYEGELDKGEILRLQLVENLLRENLSPIEEARAFQRLVKQEGYTGKQVAEELSVPESKVSRSLALLRLPEEVQRQVEAGKIAPRVAYEITKAATSDKQRRLTTLAVEGRFGLKEAANAARPKKRRRVRRSRSVNLTFPLETGWTVQVSCRSAGNYHEVEQALQLVLEDVRQRIRANVQIL